MLQIVRRPASSLVEFRVQAGQSRRNHLIEVAFTVLVAVNLFLLSSAATFCYLICKR